MFYSSTHNFDSNAGESKCTSSNLENLNSSYNLLYDNCLSFYSTLSADNNILLLEDSIHFSTLTPQLQTSENCESIRINESNRYIHECEANRKNLYQIKNKIYLINNQLEWIEIYNLLDEYLTHISESYSVLSHIEKDEDDYIQKKKFTFIFGNSTNSNYLVYLELEYLFIECCKNKLFNVCEYIFRKFYKCDISLDICHKIIEIYKFKTYDKYTHAWINYIHSSHFINCSTVEKNDIYMTLCQNKLLMDKYFFLFWLYYFENREHNPSILSEKYIYNYLLEDDIFNENTYELSLYLFLKNFDLSKAQLFEKGDIKFNWLMIYFKVYRHNNTTLQWFNIIKAWEKKCILEKDNMQCLYLEIFEDYPYYILDNIDEFFIYEKLLYKCFEHFSKDATVKHKIKKIFYDCCVANNINVAYIIFCVCKNDIFLFDYIHNDKTALDILLSNYEYISIVTVNNSFENSDKDGTDSLKNSDNKIREKIYFIFDNYKDPLCKYPVYSVNTFDNMLSKCNTIFESIDELIIYFINNYEHTVGYFLYENIDNSFIDSIRDCLFKKYPELVFSLKFSHYFTFAAPKEFYIPKNKVDRICKQLYIPIELSNCIKMTYEEYFRFAIQYKL